MTNIKDLNLEDEIVPLFNYTYNDFSKEFLIHILTHPLSSKDEIINRQLVLKSFIANHNILSNYSYSRLDLLEVHAFLAYSNKEVFTKGLKLKFFLSETIRHQTSRKYIQTILLFHRLNSYYFKRIETRLFPENYKSELQSLNEFFNSFNLNHYEKLIQDQKFKASHVIELATLIFQKAKQGEFEIFWKRFFSFEANLSLSIGITKQKLSFPTMSETSFSLHDFFHPLLKNPVKNSFSTNQNVILLTGPNMSGKSTFLKAVSLCIYLGHIGVGIPASKGEMPFFNSISVLINLNDNILSGYSHFMTEVLNLKSVVVQAAGKSKCFAVFDEIFRGTNIEDAVEISTTTIKGLSSFKNSIFFISTHLHQLKQLEEVISGKVDTLYLDCELKGKMPLFNYQLKKGWSDLKVGQILFESEGLNSMLSVRRE